MTEEAREPTMREAGIAFVLWNAILVACKMANPAAASVGAWMGIADLYIEYWEKPSKEGFLEIAAHHYDDAINRLMERHKEDRAKAS